MINVVKCLIQISKNKGFPNAKQTILIIHKNCHEIFF